MGHYLSEMQGDTIAPERHPKPLPSMGFEQFYSSEFSYETNDFWVHRPCLQVFYIPKGRWGTKVPNAIYHHANHCPMMEDK